MKVKEVMSVEVQTVSPGATITNAAKKMNKYHIGSLVVILPGFEVVGIITERDILKSFARVCRPGIKVKDIMTKGVIAIDKNASLEEAADRMTKYGIKRLVVTHKNKCAGSVTATDLMLYESQLTDKLFHLLQKPKKLLEGG